MKHGTWVVKDGKKTAMVRGADGKLSPVPAPEQPAEPKKKRPAKDKE